MDEAVSLGRLDAPGYFDDPMIRKAYQRARWEGDGPGNLNPLQEAKAVKERVDIGLTSLQEEKRGSDGGDWETTHNQRVTEHNARQEAGLIEQKEAELVPPDGSTP
jgi:capsid protein